MGSRAGTLLLNRSLQNFCLWLDYFNLIHFNMSWGYGADNGPSCWHKDFPVAKEGRRQSPIDITPDSAVDATSQSREKPLKWVYDTKHCLNIENTGSSWNLMSTAVDHLWVVDPWKMMNTNYGNFMLTGEVITPVGLSIQLMENVMPPNCIWYTGIKNMKIPTLQLDNLMV